MNGPFIAGRDERVLGISIMLRFRDVCRLHVYLEIVSLPGQRVFHSNRLDQHILVVDFLLGTDRLRS